jgi:PASTA domain
MVERLGLSRLTARRRIVLAGLAGAIVLLSAITVAAAASGSPIAGATYKGTINDDPNLPITFDVSSDGSSVTDIQIPRPIPLSCLQSPTGAQTTTSAPAPIYPASETFTASVSYPQIGNLVVVMAGQFLANHTVTGSLSFTVVSLSSTCSDGATYTAEPNTGTKAPACIVPKVVGKQLAAARKALEKHHCRVGTVKRVRSRQGRGRVVAQNPKPHTHLSPPGKVALKVSKGR